MTEENFEELYNQSLNNKRFDKTVTGTVIQISSKGEIFVDFKYNVDGIIPRKEYSDDETKNPKDEFKVGDTITADVLKWNDGLGNVLLSYKKYKVREEAQKARELKIKQAEEREARKIERTLNTGRKSRDFRWCDFDFDWVGNFHYRYHLNNIDL